MCTWVVVNSEAIKLSAEFLKLFVRGASCSAFFPELNAPRSHLHTEAAHRAGELALAQDEAEVSMDTLEKILPQLVCVPAPKPFLGGATVRCAS